MSNRFAVIDLGTNTFHILIAEQETATTFNTLYQKRFFVKLAEEGIETIGKAPFQRGLEALSHFRKIIADLGGVQKVKAVGTAALRTATNGPSFIQTVREQLGIQIEVIDGDQEAALIHKGVALAVPFKEQNFLLMDIGGGSVEFIIANKNQVYWAQSFPIGVGILFKKFHLHDPILKSEIDATKQYIDSFLSSLKQALLQYPASILVGASGTFDVLEYVLAKENTHPTHARVAVHDFFSLYQRMLNTTVADRLAMKDIPDDRADMIVVAIILIDYVLSIADSRQIIVSKYAMKEGILSELLEDGMRQK